MTRPVASFGGPALPLLMLLPSLLAGGCAARSKGRPPVNVVAVRDKVQRDHRYGEAAAKLERARLDPQDKDRLLLLMDRCTFGGEAVEVQVDSQVAAEALAVALNAVEGRAHIQALVI